MVPGASAATRCLAIRGQSRSRGEPVTTVSYSTVGTGTGTASYIIYFMIHDDDDIRYYECIIYNMISPPDEDEETEITVYLHHRNQ
jgi:hypothetical protein